MSELSTMPTLTRLDYATPNGVFAGLRDGGSISVEEWPAGDLKPIAELVGRQEGVLLLQIAQDVVGGAPIDTVSMHPDEDNRLALIARAIQALENARAALLACGYRDLVHLREQR